MRAYLYGAVHDGTYNERHQTFRIVQAEREWLLRIQSILSFLDVHSWLYREGARRRLYALESTAPFLKKPKQLRTTAEKIAYIKGYFDAEGGIPKSKTHGLYIQFVQKNKLELQEIKDMLEELGINSGVIHIPSYRIDPNYYRFFVKRESLQKFLTIIGSNHPRKEKLVRFWMKI